MSGGARGGAAKSGQPVRPDLRVGVEQHDVGAPSFGDAAVRGRREAEIALVAQHANIRARCVAFEQGSNRRIRARIVDGDKARAASSCTRAPIRCNVRRQRGRIVNRHDDRDVFTFSVQSVPSRHDATDFAEPRHRDVRRVNCGDSRMAKADSAAALETAVRHRGRGVAENSVAARAPLGENGNARIARPPSTAVSAVREKNAVEIDRDAIARERRIEHQRQRLAVPLQIAQRRARRR